MSGNSEKNGMNWPSENKGARNNPDSFTTPGKFIVGTPHKIKPVGIIGGSTRT